MSRPIILLLGLTLALTSTEAPAEDPPPASSQTGAASMIAVSCGMPTPATIRVVQIEPGPIPTLTASAPDPINALVPSAVATFPATTWTWLESFFTRSTAALTARPSSAAA